MVCENFHQAKEIFLKYRGNKFFMQREGVLDSYKEFHITNDVEKKWMSEYMVELSSALMNEPVKSKRTELFRKFIRTVDRQDKNESMFLVDYLEKFMCDTDILNAYACISAMVQKYSADPLYWDKKVLTESLFKCMSWLNVMKDEMDFDPPNYTNNNPCPYIHSNEEFQQSIRRDIQYCKSGLASVKST